MSSLVQCSVPRSVEVSICQFFARPSTELASFSFSEPKWFEEFFALCLSFKISLISLLFFIFLLSAFLKYLFLQNLVFYLLVTVVVVVLLYVCTWMNTYTHLLSTAKFCTKFALDLKNLVHRFCNSVDEKIKCLRLKF